MKAYLIEDSGRLTTEAGIYTRAHEARNHVTKPPFLGLVSATPSALGLEIPKSYSDLL